MRPALCTGNRRERKLAVSVESVLSLPGHSFCHTPLSESQFPSSENNRVTDALDGAFQF